MKNKFLLLTGLITLLSSSLYARHNGGTLENCTVSTLSQEAQDSIVYIANEERMINDLYTNVNSTISSSTLTEAIKSSSRDVKSANALASKYDLNISVYPESVGSYSATDVAALVSGVYAIEDIQTNYTVLYESGIASEQAALEMGCMATVMNIEDINDSIVLVTESNATDVVSRLNHIQRHNYRNYTLFNTALVNLDVTDGCCSLDEEYCHAEYLLDTEVSSDDNSTVSHSGRGKQSNRSSRGRR